MWSGFWARVVATLRRDFIAGLLVFIPVGFTAVGVLWILEQLDNLVLPRVFAFFDMDPGRWPYLGVFATLGMILLAGALTRSFVGRGALRIWERLVERIPIARSLYAILKQSTQALLTGGGRGQSFRSVVLIEYPRSGLWTYAFVTGQVSHSPQGLPDDLLRIFVPSTPNPTTGYLLLVPAAHAIATDLSVEDAFKLIVSAGIAHDDAPIEAVATVESPAADPAAAPAQSDG